jgi:hypothetical protein
MLICKYIRQLHNVIALLFLHVTIGYHKDSTTDWINGVRSPTDPEDFPSNLCVQTDSGAHPASCTMGTGGSLSGGKVRPERDADHSPPSSAEVKKE